MPDPQTAIRETDEVTHSHALAGAIAGIVTGLVVGALVGAFIVGTGGLGAIALVGAGAALTTSTAMVGATLVGATLVGGSIGGMFGRMWGGHAAYHGGRVLTGSPNVFIGFDKKRAARAEADVAHCEDHADAQTAHDQPGVLGQRIVQGSGTVLINNFPAARKGDHGKCDFVLGDGWNTVFIGGPTVTTEKINGEVPAIVDHIILGMGIVGTGLLMLPGAVAMFSAGAAMGLTGSVLGVGANLAQVSARLYLQYKVGMKLSELGGETGHEIAHLFHQEDGSLWSDTLTLGGQTAAPFAGGRLYKGIGEAGFPAAEPAVAGRGPTGARTSFDGTPAEQARADAAYERIRADDGDVSRIANNTGYPEEHIAAVKQHLFYNEHDIAVGDAQTGDLQTSRQRFTPDPWIADRWTKAADGTLGEPDVYPSGNIKPNSADPSEVSDFHNLISHEYVEQGLMSDGLPYRSPESWGQGESGWNFHPDAQNAGAHDLAPLATPDGADVFSHYEGGGRYKGMGRSSEGIPRPNEDLSNLPDVLDAIRRSQGPDTPSGPVEPDGPEGGPPGGGPSGRSPSGRAPPSGKPLAEPFVPARPLPPTVVEGMDAVPPGEAAPVAVADAAPEATAAALPKAEPEDALGNPEPSPEAAVLADDPLPSRKTYNEFDMSKKAVDFRANEKDPQGLYNVAVFEYVDPDSGNLAMEAFKSEGRFKPHSEKVGLRKLLGERKIAPDQIKRVYSEREPCELPGNYCGRLLKREIPDTPVFHSFEYGGDRATTKVEAEASRQRGNDALAKALDSIFGGSQ